MQPTISAKAITLAFGFFIGMVVMELALESVAANFHSKLTGGSLPSLVTLAQFAWCFLLPLVIDPSTYKTISFQPEKVVPYIVMSFIVACATGLATASLHYVNYPVKIVFKSTKLIPTMVISTILLGNSHAIAEYVAACFLCFGTALFVYRPPDKSSGDIMDASSLFGSVLLFSSVVFDSILPNLQKRMMSKVSPEELMLNTNLIGAVGMVAYICVFSDHLDRICAYLASDDEFKWSLLLQLCVVGSSLGFAVLCYTSLIKETGPVVAVTVSTLRKVVTLVLSYIVFPKSLGWRELAALVLIGAGVAIENLWKHAFERTSTAEKKSQGKTTEALDPRQRTT